MPSAARLGVVRRGNAGLGFARRTKGAVFGPPISLSEYQLENSSTDRDNQSDPEHDAVVGP